MKLLVASDIHGAAEYMEHLFNRIKEEHPDRVILLGDLLYHGPRNNLPDSYNTMYVAAMLNSIEVPIICVRGNCDAEVDQVMVEFPIMAEYAVVDDGKRTIFATHGHSMDWSRKLLKDPSQILLSGHIHTPGIWYEENCTRINPGSVSLPRNNTPHSYAVLEDNLVIWKDVTNGQEYDRVNLSIAKE